MVDLAPTRPTGGVVVLEFEAVMPIGARTCADIEHHRGPQSNVWLSTDVPEYAAEWTQLQQGQLDPDVARRHHLDTVGQLQSLMGRAEKGQLAVGKTKDFPVRVINSVGYLLEMRPALTSPDRVFRLYYAEPAAVGDALLPLLLRTKAASSDTREQNAAIEDAKTRSRTWMLYKVIGAT